MMMMMTHLCLALMAPASLLSLLPCVHLSLCAVLCLLWVSPAISQH